MFDSFFADFYALAVLVSYTAGREAMAVRASTAAAAEAAAAAKAAADARGEEENALVDACQVVSSLLNEACPHCAQPYDAFTGCFALTCSSSESGFCALCLADCGADAHPHLGCAPRGAANPAGPCEFVELLREASQTDEGLAAARKARRTLRLWCVVTPLLRFFSTSRLLNQHAPDRSFLAQGLFGPRGARA